MRVLKSERSQIQSQLVKQRLLQEALLNKERLKYKHAWEEYLIGPKRVHQTLSEIVSNETSSSITRDSKEVLKGLAKKKTRRSIYENQGIAFEKSVLQEEEIRPRMDKEESFKREIVASQPPGEMVLYIKEIA